jgi:hypothetical protein
VSAPDPLRAARLERRVLAAIVASGIALAMIGFHWGLPNVESWSGDDIAPGKPLRVLNDWLWESHKYPYLHWWLNLPLYLPWLAGVGLLGQVDAGCFPRLRSSCFENPWRDMTVFIALSRLLSVAMGVGIVLGTRRLALVVHGDRGAALLAAGIAAGSPLLVFFSHTSNLDVPATFWFTWSLVAAAAVWQRGAPVDYGLLGGLVACALTTKDAIVGGYLLPALALAGVHLARVHREAARGGAPLLWRALADRRLHLLLGAFLGVYVVVQNVVFNFSGFVEHWRFWLVEGSPVYEALRARSTTVSKTSWRLGLIFESLLGLPMLLLCGLGLVYAAAGRRRALVLGLPALSYVVVSLLPTFLAPRLALPLLPAFAVWGGLLASRVLRASGPARLVGAGLLALAFAHEYAAALHLDLRMLGDSRYEAEAWLAEHVPRDRRIAALSAAKAMPRVERMGYEVRWHPIDAIRRGTLEADGAEWVLLTSGGFPGSDRRYLDDLRAGRLGYELAYLAEGRARIRGLDPRLGPGSLSPPIYVLRKRVSDAQRPGTENR